MTRVFRGINWLTALIISCAMLVAWLQPVKFLGDPDWASSAVTLILVIATLVILSADRHWVTHWSLLTYQRMVWVGLGLILMVQLWMAFSFVDVARADAFFIRSQAIKLAQGQTNWQHYFMIYPNNVNFTLLEATLLKGLLRLTRTPWQWLNVIRFLWLDTGLVSGLVILKEWRRFRPAALTFVGLWLLSLPIYAYGLFAYTDALVLPLIMDTLALMVASLRAKQGWQRLIWQVLAGLLVGFGVMMKSNLIVLWIALSLLLLVLGWQKQLSWRHVGIRLIVTMLMLGVAWGAMSNWRRQECYQSQPNSALPATSWIMMSLNPKSSGQYVGKDFKLVNQQPTTQKKQAVADQMIKQRTQQLGLCGLAVHWLKKFRVFWATGNFDSFKLTSQWMQAPSWYINHQRAIQFWLVLGTQVIYLTMLIQVGWLLWHSLDWRVIYLALSMLGLMCFHVIFWEVEGRYALPILPGLFLLTAVADMPLPSPHWLANNRWSVSSSAVVLAAFSVISLWETSQSTLIKSEGVNRQGNGSYIQATAERLQSRQQTTTQITTDGLQTNQMILSPRQQRGAIRVQLLKNSKVIKRWSGTVAQLTTLNYPQTRARQLTLIIRNTGRQTISYGAMRAPYSPDTGRVTEKSQAYLQYKVRQRFPTPRTLTQSATSGRIIGLGLVVTLMTVWMPVWTKRHRLEEK